MKKMARWFVIAVKDARVAGKALVAGFNHHHEIVQLTNDPKLARRFPTEGQAERWMDRYANAGYGLASTDATIEPFNA